MSENSNLEMSEFRKIKSLSFLYEINGNGTCVRNVKSKKISKRGVTDDGYEYCLFTIGGRKGKTFRRSVAGMVAECWLGDRPDGLQIDHIDRNRRNNDYRNLRYATRSEQMRNRVLSDRLIAIATRNCYNYTMRERAKPVTITCPAFRITFASMQRCSNFLGGFYKANPEHMRAKLKKRRSHIYDFNISYIAETGHGNLSGKEQSESILLAQ